MQAFDSTIATTHELLDLYVRLSSQAEHTQNLLLDGQWQGVTKVRPSPPPPLLANPTRTPQDIQLLAAREAEEARLSSEAAEREEQLREEAAAAALRVSAKREEDARRGTLLSPALPLRKT